MLFRKEMKKTIFSITFLIFLIALIAMPISQDILDFSNEIITKPLPGADYGTQKKEVPELIMPAAFQSLYQEFKANQYIAYPIGFYKTVKLKATDQERMAEIISVLSGVSVDELLESDTSSTSNDGIEITFDENQNYIKQEDGSMIITHGNEPSDQNRVEITLLADISYEEFKEYMKQVDDLIGGGSAYSEKNLIDFGDVPITFEEATEEYNLVANKDHFTGAYARLFCDYIGSILSILPVFLGVAICLRDRRARMHDLVYARKTSSFQLIMTRYLAIIIAVVLPTIITIYISNSSVWKFYDGMRLDYFAPLKYVVGWLMPSIMIATAIGMFLTELTGTPIAIAVQGIWWFIDINVVELSGGFTLFHLTPRHNALGKTQIFQDGFHTLVANRVLFAGIALGLMFATAMVYEQKRRGRLNGSGYIKKAFTGLANRKSKSKA